MGVGGGEDMHGGDKGMLFKGGKVKSVKVEDEKDGGLAKTFKVVMIAASTNQCGKVYGQGTYVCLRKGCQVKHQRAVDLARGTGIRIPHTRSHQIGHSPDCGTRVKIRNVGQMG